jgi:AraC-like DNA-binding protein
MASSEVRSFTDPVEYGAAIQGMTVDLSPSVPGPFDAGFTRVRFNSFGLLRTRESQPRIARLTPCFESGFLISFQIESEANVYELGTQRPRDSIAQIAMNQPFFQRSDKGANHGSMLLSPGVIESIGPTATGRDITPPRKHTIITPRPGALTKLRELHRAVGLLAVQAPDALDHPEVGRGLEQALLQAMVACLDTNDTQKDRRAHAQHAAIMQRFHRALDADPERALYVLEIAKAIGVSMRSLSAICQEHLGVGPKRYLLLRRLNQARRALTIADQRDTTVTDVATQFGFWQLGRFAVEYKRLFGESPSATLRGQRA